MRRLLIILAFTLSAFAQVANPLLTPLEQQQRANLMLRQQNITYQQQLLERDVADFVKSVNAAHPGFQLTDKGELLPVPKPDTKPVIKPDDIPLPKGTP